jgi:26S proteasome regulatory subunit N8
VLDGELPVNHAIMGNLQDVFNLLPTLTTPKANPQMNGSTKPQTESNELARAMSVKTNDQLMTIYLSSLIRAITAFHDLIENKIQNRQQQEEKDAKKEEGKEGKEGKEDKEGKKNGAAEEAKDGEGNGKEKAKEGSKKK